MRPAVVGSRSGSLLRRYYVSGTQAKRNTVLSAYNRSKDAKNSVTPPPPSRPLAAPSATGYLKTLRMRDLLPLVCIGAVTCNKTALDWTIKLFPHIPLFLVQPLMSRLYCGGSNESEVVQCARDLYLQRGISNIMLSLTIEDSEGTKNIDINYIVSETISSIENILLPHIEAQLSRVDVNDIATGYIALKPSALVANPAQVLSHFNDPNWAAQRDQLVDNCSKIAKAVFDINQKMAQKYPQRVAPFLCCTIDAEKYLYQTKGVYNLQNLLFKKFNPASNNMVTVIGTWQLYLKDSFAQLLKDYQLARQYGYKLGLKLVRGAYVHSEPNRNEIIFNEKEGTDANYNKVLTHVLNEMASNGSQSPYGHVVVASHNYESQLLTTLFLNESNQNTFVTQNVVQATLLGMGDSLAHDLITKHNAKTMVKYVPWGPPQETRDYLLRRLQENSDAVRSDNGWPLLKNIVKSFI